MEHLPNGIVIRPYSAQQDAQVVRGIAADIWRGSGYEFMEQRFGVIGGKPWQEWMARAVMTDIDAPETRSFVAEQDNTVIGFCSYTVNTEQNRGSVGYNGVALAHQGKRLGSAMLRFVLSRIQGEGLEYADVIVADNDEHEPARRMYERHGFQKLGGFYYMVQKFDSDESQPQPGNT